MIRLVLILAAWLAGCIADLTKPGLPGSAEVVTPALFVGAGDIAKCGSNKGDEQTANLLDNIPGTVFTLGDNVYHEATAAAWRDCYAPSWGRHRGRTRPAPGNHDYNSSGATPYFAYYGNMAGPAGLGYYSFNLSGWHIVSLNSERPSTAQTNWLKADLAATSARCVLAYWHHPLFTSGARGLSSKGSSSRAFWNALYAANADLILVAHEHHYERFGPINPSGQRDPAGRGLRQFVVGTGGAGTPYQFGTPKPNSEVRYRGGYGVLKLWLYPDRYAWRFQSVAGKTFSDSGVTVCH